jgi:hypothetical protein
VIVIVRAAMLMKTPVDDSNTAHHATTGLIGPDAE